MDSQNMPLEILGQLFKLTPLHTKKIGLFNGLSNQFFNNLRGLIFYFMKGDKNRIITQDLAEYAIESEMVAYNYKGTDPDEPICCAKFGCNKKLSTTEILCGTRCINHTKINTFDITKIIKL